MKTSGARYVKLLIKHSELVSAPSQLTAEMLNAGILLMLHHLQGFIGSTAWKSGVCSLQGIHSTQAPVTPAGILMREQCFLLFITQEH